MRQLRVEPVVHLVDGVGQQRQAAQREVLALGRDDHAVAAGQPVDGEQAQRRLAVDQHVVVAVEHRVQRAGQRLFAADLVDQLDLGGRQVDVARHQVQPRHPGGDQHLVDRHPRLDQQVVHGVVELVVRHAETRRQRALRVEVDEQHPAAVLGEAGAQIDRRGGLADAALLVAHRDDLGRAVASCAGAGSGMWRRKAGRSSRVLGSGSSAARVVAHARPSLVRHTLGRGGHRGKFNGERRAGEADPQAMSPSSARQRDPLPRPRMGAGPHLPQRVDRDHRVDLRGGHRCVTRAAPARRARRRHRRAGGWRTSGAARAVTRRR